MPTCLFVCADHALASRLAEGLFNAQAPKGWRGTSAGVDAAAEADPRADATLSQLGYPVPKDPPRAAEKDLLSFMRVVVGICLPTDRPIPEALSAKLDLRIDLPDPKGVEPDKMTDWMVSLNEKLTPVLNLCRERTPRPFG
jgi:protein-tyrosine-phosphatase